MTRPMRVLGVSSNTGPFGHSQHVFCDENGAIYAVERIRSSWPGQWNPGDWVNVPLKPGLPATPNFRVLGAEWQSYQRTITGEHLEEAMAPDYLERIAAKAKALKDKLDADEATEEELAIIKEMGGANGMHGTEEKRPEYYRCPLRSRASIVAWLRGNKHWTRHADRDTVHLFAFNVKLHNLDFSFDNLWAKFQESGYASEEQMTDKAWLAACRKHFDEEGGERNQRLWEYSVSDACDQVVSTVRVKDKWVVCTADTYSRTWSRDDVDVDLGFHGRSGGWLVIEKFQGLKLTRSLDLEDPDEIDYRTLRLLYEYVTMLSHDFRDGQPELAVEDAAAFMFFENSCSDIPTASVMTGDGI